MRAGLGSPEQNQAGVRVWASLEHDGLHLFFDDMPEEHAEHLIAHSPARSPIWSGWSCSPPWGSTGSRPGAAGAAGGRCESDAGASAPSSASATERSFPTPGWPRRQAGQAGPGAFGPRASADIKRRSVDDLHLNAHALDQRDARGRRVLAPGGRSRPARPPLEEQAAVLIGEALRGPAARALAVLDALDARQEPLSEEEAARLAEEEIRAMRAERRASGRR